jgi:hypothetical protein
MLNSTGFCFIQISNSESEPVEPRRPKVMPRKMAAIIGKINITTRLNKTEETG